MVGLTYSSEMIVCESVMPNIFTCASKDDFMMLCFVELCLGSKRSSSVIKMDIAWILYDCLYALL